MAWFVIAAFVAGFAMRHAFAMAQQAYFSRRQREMDVALARMIAGMKLDQQVPQRKALASRRWGPARPPADCSDYLGPRLWE